MRYDGCGCGCLVAAQEEAEKAGGQARSTEDTDKLRELEQQVGHTSFSLTHPIPILSTHAHTQILLSCLPVIGLAYYN
jgi:hypothetical protein